MRRYEESYGQGGDPDRYSTTVEKVVEPGCEPNPVERHEADGIARAIYCSMYNHCNMTAIKGGWKGWDCTACPTEITKDKLPEVEKITRSGWGDDETLRPPPNPRVLARAKNRKD